MTNGTRYGKSAETKWEPDGEGQRSEREKKTESDITLEVAHGKTERENDKQGADHKEEEEEEAEDGDNGVKEEETKPKREDDEPHDWSSFEKPIDSNDDDKNTIETDPSSPLQRIDPLLPRRPQTQIDIDERKLINLYLPIQLANPNTNSKDRVTRAIATIHNLRTLMAQVSASGETYNKLAKLRLRNGEWGSAILAAMGLLMGEGEEIPEWTGGAYEDFLEGWVGRLMG
ncbi:hypothetical protein EG327_004991 [Venturia inaequalis]|uniref:Uncharacterized protein n=1 Tax=Venturia inaequalis TaxID=5025 RepID=A0A8H3VBG8_VENIN|nr:hypothetical protein EG327_004991 [Venturia inaequalis]